MCCLMISPRMVHDLHAKHAIVMQVCSGTIGVQCLNKQDDR
jgi:hypothetical protein